MPRRSPPPARAPTEPPAPGPLADLGALADRYEVVRRLGQGGMATVYEVRCRRFGRRLALKVLRPDTSQLARGAARLQREAASLARLDHANCVRLVEHGRTPGGGLYLVMELAQGQSLCRDLGRPLPVRRALEIVRQVLLALEHAHAAGVVHRDVKPDNVMVAHTARGLPLVKVLDFGFCRLLDDALPAEGRRLTGGYVMGTPTYMAPEIVERGEADERSDLYAVGVMLFYLLTGRRPFPGRGPLEILRAKMHGRPPQLSDVAPGAFSAELCAAVDRALQRDPALRFASAAEFVAALVAVQRQPGGGLATRGASSAPAAARAGGLGRVLSACRQLLSVVGAL